MELKSTQNNNNWRSGPSTPPVGKNVHLKNKKKNISSHLVTQVELQEHAKYANQVGHKNLRTVKASITSDISIKIE